MSAVINGLSVGVLPGGFVRPALSDIKADLENAFKTAFGQGINVLPGSNFGQIIGIMAERFDSLWGMAQDLYNAGYPDTAANVSLDYAVAINAVERLGATNTKIRNVNMTGTPGATVIAGKLAALSGSGLTASLDATVTFDGGGNAVGNFTATSTGPIAFPASQMTIIQTPVTGWNTVSNPTDGVPGTNVETDPALKARRLLSLETSIAGPIDAIRNALLKVSGVSQVVVYENQYNTPDISVTPNRPPHSFQAYVFGGADQDIIQAIWNSKDGGIQAFGDVCGNAVDSQGRNQPICFSRLIQDNVYGIANIHTDLTFPGGGDLLVKEAVVNYINSLIGGQSLIVSPHLICQLDGIPGILSVQLLVGLAPSPSTSNNIIEAINHILRSDTSLWTVNHV